MKPWGILGNPTKEEIEHYQNMSHGEFKKMVKNIKKPLKTYHVKISAYKEVDSQFIKVSAESEKQALDKAKNQMVENIQKILKWYINNYTVL